MASGRTIAGNSGLELFRLIVNNDFGSVEVEMQGVVIENIKVESCFAVLYFIKVLLVKIEGCPCKQSVVIAVPVAGSFSFT